MTKEEILAEAFCVFETLAHLSVRSSLPGTIFNLLFFQVLYGLKEKHNSLNANGLLMTAPYTGQTGLRLLKAYSCLECLSPSLQDQNTHETMPVAAQMVSMVTMHGTHASRYSMLTLQSVFIRHFPRKPCCMWWCPEKNTRGKKDYKFQIMGTPAKTMHDAKQPSYINGTSLIWLSNLQCFLCTFCDSYQRPTCPPSVPHSLSLPVL